jgi:exopolysaccharide production protein ExoQ
MVWLIRRDTAGREGISGALWIPTLWVGIISSRPVSAWLGSGGAVDTLEGSPIDRVFFFGMIFAALFVLSRRGVSWQLVISRNWPLFLFYGFLLVSVLWANSPLSSFKRWFKEFGNIVVLLVILTEVNPQQAFRAVFVRCAYVLIPLSIIFVRYFPELGRRYTRAGGMEVTGVTFQKNTLGIMIVVFGLVLIWDWFERMRSEGNRIAWMDRLMPVGLLGMGAYLLHLCNSQTSITALILGGFILTAAKLPLLRDRIGALGLYSLLAFVSFFIFDWLFGIKEEVLEGMGRDSTLTGRTDVWRELLAVGTDPLLGTGFMSFWDDLSFRSKLPEWVAFSAHNGYLEVYLAGGFVGLFFLALMLLGTGFQINRDLAWGNDYDLMRWAAFVVTLVSNFSESNFCTMTPIGFLFLLTAIGYAESKSGQQSVPIEESIAPIEPYDRPVLNR